MPSESFDVRDSSSITTRLTPNVASVVTASGNDNDETSVAFTYAGEVTCLRVALSIQSATWVATSDLPCARAMLFKGLTLVLVSSGTGYAVVITGKIRDGNSDYPLTGLVIGTFNNESDARSSH